MINPSISGWINKYFSEFNSAEKIDEIALYDQLRSAGFIYGNIVGFISENIKTDNDLTDIELAKITYLEAFHQCYLSVDNDSDQTLFIEKSNAFFESLKPYRSNFLDKILPKNTAVLNLENTINDRIYINENNLSKKFSNLIMNAFLFVDILAFQQFLSKKEIPKNYLSDLESGIMNVLALALKTKSNKSHHDDLLIKLFENSLRYIDISNIKYLTLDTINFKVFETNFDKKYVVDLASLALYNDNKIENNEIYFLQKLCEKLKLSDDFASESIEKTTKFIETNKPKLSLFNNSNAVSSFYNQTAQTVMKLILRNKKRLGKEISQSAELMKLLAISAKRDLSDDEKIKVKKQLLDICKTVPSLTIFLIPGGSLLLPILIKFIPQLLPSAFNENLEDE